MLYLRTSLETQAEYCTSGRFISKEGGSVHPDRLLYTYVVLFGGEGACFIRQNGVDYTLTPDTYLILLAGFRHTGTAPCPPDTSYYWSHFLLHGNTEFVGEEEMRETSSLLREQASENGTCTSLLLPEFGRVSSPDRIRLLFHSLIDKSRSLDVYRAKECGFILSEILCELSDAFIDEGREVGRKQQAKAAGIIEYIRVNAARIRSVSEIAEYFGYNPEYMTTLLKRASGLSVIEHINRAKIEEAKKLLLTTTLTVKEIAERVGYSGSRYLSRLFRQETGLTPSEYRSVYFKTHMNKE